MAVRNDITFDWDSSPRIITVDSPSIEISMQDLYDTCRDAEIDQLDEDSIISGAGKEPLGGGVTVGLTIILLNAQLAFEARTGPSFIICNASGGNLVAVDSDGDPMVPIYPTAYTTVVLAQSTSATLIQQDALVETLKMVANKVTKSGDVITVYEDDEVTPFRQYNLANGERIPL
jgi:hypothetical protein